MRRGLPYTCYTSLLWQQRVHFILQTLHMHWYSFSNPSIGLPQTNVVNSSVPLLAFYGPDWNQHFFLNGGPSQPSTFRPLLDTFFPQTLPVSAFLFHLCSHMVWIWCWIREMYWSDFLRHLVSVTPSPPPSSSPSIFFLSWSLFSRTPGVYLICYSQSTHPTLRIHTRSTFLFSASSAFPSASDDQLISLFILFLLLFLMLLRCLRPSPALTSRQAFTRERAEQHHSRLFVGLER